MVDQPLLPDQIVLLSDVLRSSNPLDKLPADQQVLFTLKGVIFSLEQDGSPAAAGLLSEASLTCPYEEIQHLAVQALGRLAQNGSQVPLNRLFHLAIYSEKAAAIQAIAANQFESPDATLQAVYDLLEGNSARYQALDPDYLLLTDFFLSEIPQELSQRISLAAQIAGMNNWVLIASAVKNFTPEASNRLVEQFSIFTEVEKRLLLRLLDEKTEQGSEIAGDTLCKLYIYQDRPPPPKSPPRINSYPVNNNCAPCSCFCANVGMNTRRSTSTRPCSALPMKRPRRLCARNCST